MIALRCDWHRSKGLLKGFKLALRPWKSSKNWWRYDQMKFVTEYIEQIDTVVSEIKEIDLFLGHDWLVEHNPEVD